MHFTDYAETSPSNEGHPELTITSTLTGSINQQKDPIGKQELKKLLKKNAEGIYVCDCGYNAGNKSNRLINHQLQHCPNREKAVRTDIPCPICAKQFTYGGLKSHLLPFTRTNRKISTYNEAHADKNSKEHQEVLQKVKAMYGPKKQ